MRNDNVIVNVWNLSSLFIYVEQLMPSVHEEKMMKQNNARLASVKEFFHKRIPNLLSSRHIRDNSRHFGMPKR